MLWLGSLFRPDARWWASTLERPNRQHCHPHGNKNKKSPLAPSSRIAVVSPSILEPSLHARIAAACSTATALPRTPASPRPQCSDMLHRARAPPPAFLSHYSLPSSLSRRGVVHSDCSGAAFFTTRQLLACCHPPSPLQPSAAC